MQEYSNDLHMRNMTDEEYKLRCYKARKIRKKRRKERRRKAAIKLAFILLIIVVLIGGMVIKKKKIIKEETSVSSADSEVDASDSSSEQEKKLHIIETSDEYPDDMVEFAKKYPEAIDYVYNYPELKDKSENIDLSKEAGTDDVPLLLQWDSRWGYISYGSGLIGYTGCGPVSLSMAALYLTHNKEWTPKKVAEIANEKGYCVPGSGSSWTLISEGCQYVGLSAQTLSLDETVMKNALDAGEPIIVVVGPGDFTFSGHFMVITGYNENGFTINDPNSTKNSMLTWDFERLSKQIQNMWAMSKM